jgi:hypothetical protein
MVVLSLPQADLDALGRLLNGLPLGQQRARAGMVVLAGLQRDGGLERPGVFDGVAAEYKCSLIQTYRELVALAKACVDGSHGAPWTSRYVMVRFLMRLWGSTAGSL